MYFLFLSFRFLWFCRYDPPNHGAAGVWPLWGLYI